MSLLKRILLLAVLSLCSTQAVSYDYPRPVERLRPLVMDCYQPGLVALTFDDGPSNNFPYILDILKRNDTPATFFLLGKKLTEDHQVSRALQAVEDGHQIGNHGWDHTRFTSISVAQTLEQVNMTNQIIWDKLGVTVRFVRAPHGQIDVKRAMEVWDLEQGVASWNLDPQDYKTGLLWPPQRVLDQVKSALEGASPTTDSFIIDLHDFSDNTTAVLEEMIQVIKNAGFSLVSLNECVDKGR